MSSNAKFLMYHGTPIAFVKINETWTVSVKNVGQAIGYTGRGRRLVSSVKRWLKQGLLSPIVNPDQMHMGQVCTLTGERLQAFLDACRGVVPNLELSTDSGTSNGTGTPGTLTVMSLNGLRSVTTISRVPGVIELRERWEELVDALRVGGIAVCDLVFEAPVKAKTKKSVVAVKKQPAAETRPELQRFSAVLEALDGMVKAGYLSVKLASSAVREASHTYIARTVSFDVEAGAVSGQKLLPAHTVALTKLPYDAALPDKFAGWMHAEDMGRPWGFNSRAVGQYLSDILRLRFGDNEVRANFLAKEAIGRDPEKQKACIDPDTGLSTFLNAEGNCVAFFKEDESGECHWTAYWRPDIAAWISAELGRLPKAKAAPVSPPSA